MQRRPVDPTAGVFAGGLGRHTLVTGLLIGLIALAVGMGYHAYGPEGRWQTMLFTTLAVLQVFQAFAVRSHRTSVAATDLFGNRVMNLVVPGVLALQAAAVYLPGLSDRFLGLQPLSLVDWAVTVAAGLGFVALSELLKRRRPS
jgi:Ca2+-transporting ATPase